MITSLCILAALCSATESDVFGEARWVTRPSRAHPLEQAKWIWVALPGAARPTTGAAPIGSVRLAAEVEIQEPVPAQAWFWIAADNQAEVRINGTAEGASRSWSEPAVLPVALVPGRNRIEVHAENTAGQPGAENPAGVLAALEVLEPDGHRRTLPLVWRAAEGRVVVLGPAGSPPWSFRAPPGPCPIFRRAFTVDGEVESARIFLVGLGHHELRLNGERVGETRINQAWSQYDRRIYYRELDLAAHLRQGTNVFGVLLGNSFWKVAPPPEDRWTKGDAMPDFSEGQTFLLRARAEIRYAGGRVLAVESGPDWKVRDGPLVFSHIFAGEDYDARRWPEDFDRPDFDDGGWDGAIVAKPPGAELSPEDFPGLVEREVFAPERILKPEPGTWSYVFAQNCSGVLRFRVRGAAGATLEFRPSEVIDEQGFVRQLNLHGRQALFRYTLRGGATESHQWLFHYHGFQFAELKGAVPAGQPNPGGLPVIESLELVHLRAGNETSGRFECSSELINRTHDLIDWAMRSNMSYVLTDCPHREKLGWLECAHLLARSFLARYDCLDWYEKIMRDISDAQLESGRILTVAPRYLLRDEDDAYAFTVEWGAAGVLLPWEIYLWTGDEGVLARRYESMRRFVDHVAELSPSGIAPGSLGDWYDYGHGRSPGPSRFTPAELSATACFALCLDAVRKSAGLLGRKEDEQRYAALIEQVRAAFLARFYDSEAKLLENHGSPQTAHAMALCAGLVPEADRGAVLQAILDDLEQREWQQTPGDVGHLFFIRALAEAGRSDVLHRVYSRTSKGSYGGILAKGLTTLPETWDAITVGSNSLNHCMLGHVMEWFYGYVLGLRQAPDSVGWKQFLIAPEPGELGWCRGEILTPLGPATCAWERTDQEFVMQVKIPAGATATVILPEGYGDPVFQDGQRLSTDEGPFGRRQATLPPGDHTLRAHQRRR